MSLHPDPVESVAFWPLPQGPSGLGTRLGLFSCLSALRPCWSVGVGGPEECCYPAVCVGWGTRTSAKGLSLVGSTFQGLKEKPWRQDSPLSQEGPAGAPA